MDGMKPKARHFSSLSLRQGDGEGSVGQESGCAMSSGHPSCWHEHSEEPAPFQQDLPARHGLCFSTEI